MTIILQAGELRRVDAVLKPVSVQIGNFIVTGLRARVTFLSERLEDGSLQCYYKTLNLLGTIKNVGIEADSMSFLGIAVSPGGQARIFRKSKVTQGIPATVACTTTRDCRFPGCGSPSSWLSVQPGETKKTDLSQWGQAGSPYFNPGETWKFYVVGVVRDFTKTSTNAYGCTCPFLCVVVPTPLTPMLELTLGEITKTSQAFEAKWGS